VVSPLGCRRTDGQEPGNQPKINYVEGSAALDNRPIGIAFHYPASVDPHDLPRKIPLNATTVDIRKTARITVPYINSGNNMGPGRPNLPITVPK
jgi:hypothetical protein